MSKVWSSVAIIHSTTQTVMPRGTRTSRPASSHLRTAAITSWALVRLGLPQVRAQGLVMVRPQSSQQRGMLRLRWRVWPQQARIRQT